jgi:hypothetical protein
MTDRRVHRRRDGRFALDLTPEERQLLRSIPASMRRAMAEGTPTDDPALARLHPKAYSDPDENEYEREYRALVDDELTKGRLAALDMLESSADNDSLDDEQLAAWLRAINDMRLLMGSRLAATENPADRNVSADHPDAQGYAVYDYLSWLEEQLVEAAASSL